MTSATDGRRVLPFHAERPATIRTAIVESAAAPRPEPMARWMQTLAVAAVWVAIAGGLGVRAYGYLNNPSLWIDEAMLALNVVHRTPTELLQPLDMNQGAPVGFLLTSKLAVKWFGPSEYSLRLFPFLAGLVGFAAFVPLAYRLLPLASARLAVMLFALAPYIAGYCAEFKQYESDATIAVLLMLIGHPIWGGNDNRWRLAGFAFAGAVAVWFSHPATFILGGVGLAVLADAAVRRDRAALIARFIVVGCWTVSFATCYLLFTRKLGMNQYLLDFWAGTFMPFPPKRPGDLAWMVMSYMDFFKKPGGMNADVWGTAGVAALCYAIGAFAMARTNWRLLVALIAPMVFALLASGLHKYPFANRLLLFAVPGALVMVAYGAGILADRLHTLSGARMLLFGMLLLSPVIESYWLVSQSPLHGEQAREAIEHVWNDWQDGDKLYVFYSSAPAFGYYHARYPFPADAVKIGAYNKDGPQQVFQDELQSFRGQKRVWAVVIHRQTHEETAVRAYLDGMGKCEVNKRRPDAVVMRYDLSQSR